MNELVNLEKLGKGIHKRWIYSNQVDFDLGCDYLQKINFCIQDFNNELKQKNKISIKSAIYLIILVTWIQEAYEQFESLFDTSIKDGFKYINETRLIEANKYLRAVRSFVIAHPLTTDRHKKYSLDGDYICIDISLKFGEIQKLKQEPMYVLNLHGKEKVTKVEEMDKCDYYLSVYSKKDGAKFFQYVGCYFPDLLTVASLYIDKLYALDKYLSKLKKKDFINIV